MAFLRCFALAAGAALAAAQQKGSGVTGDGLFSDFPGCIASTDRNATYCIYPVTKAVLLQGQRFDARAEVHTAYDGSAPASPFPARPTIAVEIWPNGNASAALPMGHAAFSASGTTTAVDTTGTGNAATFSTTYNTDATGQPSLPRTVTRYSWGWDWRNQVAAVPGTHTIALKVEGTLVGTVSWIIRPATARKAKNVILFIGDGLNTAQVTATRVVSRGFKNGRIQKLHMDTLSTLGFLSTMGYDSLITDSANSAASYASGQKGPQNSLNVYGDAWDVSSTSDPARIPSHVNDPKVETITEWAKRKYGSKFAVGVVTTSEIQDATPAAFWAHTRRRSDKDEITRQFFEGVDSPSTPAGSRFSVQPDIDVLLGGGASYFAPKSTFNKTDLATGLPLYCSVALTSGACRSGVESTTPTAFGPVTVSTSFASLSNRDFIAQARTAGYNVLYDRAAMYAAATKKNKVLGLFHTGNMDTWFDRRVKTANLVVANSPLPVTDYASFAARPNVDQQPDLAEMTDVALRVLDKRGEKGFFLMVEGASIDKQEHPLDHDRTWGEMIDFDNAIGVALEYARANEDTLVIVTSDHGHGYDVYGTVDRSAFTYIDGIITNGDAAAKKASRAASIGLYDRAGFPTYKDEDGDGFPDDWNTRYTLASGYVDVPFMKENFHPKDASRNPSVGSYTNAYERDTGTLGGNSHGMGMGRNMASTSGVHTLQDVPVWAEGPGSDAIRPSMENTDLFSVMADALGLGGM